MTNIIKNSENNSIQNLVIYQKLPEIIGAIKNSTITIVRSDTGSGKTIGVPYFLSQDKSFKGNIFCSVPTITATIAAHKFQSQQINMENFVGYACDGNTIYDHNTRIVYCTTGHLLNKMIKTVSHILKGNYGKYNSWFCSVLILDEFHTRTKESDICLCLWITSYKAWKENPNLPKPPKLVIMSATIDESVIKLLPTEPSVLSYIMHMYTINTIYEEQSSVYAPDSEERYIYAANVAYKYHKNNYDGIYLIFVPGKQEIDIVINTLEKIFSSGTIDILPAHGDLSMDELLKIHELSKNNRRKIIVATNIAECSITIENVSLVIDTLTHREASSGLDESLRLDLHWISKSNSKQRKGRTGRTCKGTYVILQAENIYANFADNNTPEIDRVSISYDILKLLKFGLEPKLILKSIVAEWQIDMYVELLGKLGFINYPENTVTDMGDFCSEFPLGIRKSAMLYHLRKLNDKNIFLHLAVICTLNCYGSGIFIWPKKNHGEDVFSYSIRCDDTLQKYEDKFAGYSDIDTLFKIWIEICSSINPFYITDLKNFCRDNQLNFRRFKEIIALLKQCIYIGNKNYFNIYYNFKTFIPPNIIELGKTFYHLLTLTHREYETIITHNPNGQFVAICAGLEHKIDNRSVHRMNLGNNTKKIYYSLARSQKKTKYGIVRIINLLHTIPDFEHDEENFSIFSSDTELEIDELSDLDNQNKISDKNSWSKYLSIMESKIIDTDIHQLSNQSLD